MVRKQSSHDRAAMGNDKGNNGSSQMATKGALLQQPASECYRKEHVDTCKCPTPGVHRTLKQGKRSCSACSSHPNGKNGRARLLPGESLGQKGYLFVLDFPTLCWTFPPQQPQATSQICLYGWDWHKRPKDTVGLLQLHHLARTSV